MTDPIQPATDEEVERLRVACVTIKGHPNSASASIMLGLIARIDAERARAERAEASTVLAQQVIDELRSRKSGVHFEDVRAILGKLGAGDATFSLLVETMRGAVETEIQRRFVEDGKARDDTATLTARAERAEALLLRCVEHLDDFYDEASDEYPGCALLRDACACLDTRKAQP